MKKARKAAIIFTILSALLLASCGTEERTASEKAISVGKQALEATDCYLDGEATYDRAYEKIGDLYSDMSYVSDQEFNEEHHAEDSMIRTHISSIQTRLTSDNFHNDSDSYKELLDARNKLAEDLGEKKR